MFKKLFASLLIVTFSFQSQAITTNGLKAVFDEFNYALTVEWDQKDQNFLNEQSAKLVDALRKQQNEGVSNQELMDLALSQIKDQNVLQDVRTAFSLVYINAMTPDEAQKHIKAAIGKSYQTGASWNGDAVIGALVVLFLIAGVLVLVGQNRIDDGCYQTYQCDTYCNSVYCYDDCGYKCI